MSNSYSNVIARLDRAIQYSRGDSCLVRRYGVLDAPLSRGMTTKNMAPQSRGTNAPELLNKALEKKRAQGMPVLRSHPQPRVRSEISTRAKSPQVRRNIRHSLHDGFNGLLRALPGDRAFLPPSSTRCACIVVNLTPASRRQDHTTSPSTATSFVFRHRWRPSHPAPTNRDDREAPLYRARDGGKL
jgi:hypothetical protein